MTKEPVDKYFGVPMSEKIAGLPGELPIDAVSLGQVVDGAVDGFGLSGHELIDYTRRGIHALLDYGAKPVRASGGTVYDWRVQPQYGDSRNEITEAVIAEWLAYSGGEAKAADRYDTENPANHGDGLWFALPKGGRYKVDSE